MSYLRWTNKVGAWMNNEICSEEDWDIIHSVGQAITAYPRLPQETYRVYRGKRLSRTIVESIDPTGSHFSEYMGGGSCKLIVKLKAGWSCRLMLDSGHRYGGSLSVSVDVTHDNYNGTYHILTSTPEFHERPSNVSMRRFALLGWLPMSEGDLDFYIEDKSQVAQTVADVTRYVHQMLDNLNTYLSEPPVDAQSVFSQRSGDS